MQDMSKKMQSQIANKEQETLLKKKGIFDQSITEHRQKLTLANPTLTAAPDVPFFDMLVPIDKNIKIPARIYISPDVKNQKEIPTVFWVPGTGFVATETKFTHVICTHLCKLAKCQVVVLNHRLAPENQFPIGYLDCYNVFKFFAKERPNNFAIDKNKMVVAGYSSGGNFAALIAIHAVKDGIPLAKQILISPIVDLSRVLPGFRNYEDKDTDITEEFVQWVISLYLPPDEDCQNPHVSPFFKPEKEIKKLPSTDIIFAEYDRCRGDAEHYFNKLKDQDVHVEKFLAVGEKHSYLWYNMQVTEKIAERLQITFTDISINKPLTHNFSHIRININTENNHDEDDQLKRNPVNARRSKL